MSAAPAQRLQQDARTGTSSEAIYKEQEARELVFAVVGHVGSGNSTIAEQLKVLLEEPTLPGGDFDVTILKAREEIEAWATRQGHAPPISDRSDLAFAERYQELGNQMRQSDNTAVARALIERIRKTRARKQGQEAPLGAAIPPDGTRRAYILDSVRHPAEVHLLRRLYGTAFALIGVVCDEETRLQRLGRKFKNAGEENARRFMQRDAKQAEPYGQRVADTFHMSDYFLDNSTSRLDKSNEPNLNWDISEQLSRLIRIITHAEVVRPRIAETAMYSAYGAQMRSACLSRQVGACLVDANGNIIATGTNEVPRAGGGVYGERFATGANEAARTGGSLHVGLMTPSKDGRCAYRTVKGERFCSNTREQNVIIEDLIDSIPQLRAVQAPEERETLRRQLRNVRIGSLLEFSRAVHAEMEALLSAARVGIPTRGTRMFVTTFPCHYCARHLVSAGVDEVQYIEPYPKSQALKLHDDAITNDALQWTPPSTGVAGAKVLFRPFTGTAPRLYARAFLKDRPLKDDFDGRMSIGEPDWGGPWYLGKVSYVEFEAKLSSQET